MRKAAVAGVGNNSIRPVQEGVLSLLADKSPVRKVVVAGEGCRSIKVRVQGTQAGHSSRGAIMGPSLNLAGRDELLCDTEGVKKPHSGSGKMQKPITPLCMLFRATLQAAYPATQPA